MKTPMYDPLRDNTLPARQTLTDSYWEAHAPVKPHFDSLQTHIKTQVVVIGGGFTGLNTAIALRQQGVDVVVLEANQVGWGCAGRNAGFVLPSSGRLGYSALKAKFGADAATGIVDEFHRAPRELKQWITNEAMDVDLTEGGYLKLAHNQTNAAAFEQQYNDMPSHIQQHFQLLSAEQIQTQYIDNREQSGGLMHSASFGVNPKRLVTEFAGLAKKVGVDIYHNSPVLNWQIQASHTTQARYKVHTAQASVDCDYIVLASNAYTPNRTLPALYRVQFPVLSSVLVTEPLTETQLAAFKQPGLMCMDTRAMKYYYRLLPDNRLLFGGRGAILGKNHQSGRIKTNLLKALQATLPALKAARLAYFWSGWVDVSFDDIPHIGEFPEQRNIFYATGYCGSAVAFAPLAGKRIAQMITAPQDVPDLPIYQRFPPVFPFPTFRRLGLWGYYQWLNLQHRLGM